jgi:amidophosphoribosyltransferase
VGIGLYLNLDQPLLIHALPMNLLGTGKLKDYLDLKAHRHINTDSDSEIMLQVFASQLLQTDKRRVDSEDLFTGLTNM